MGGRGGKRCGGWVVEIRQKSWPAGLEEDLRSREKGLEGVVGWRRVGKKEWWAGDRRL